MTDPAHPRLRRLHASLGEAGPLFVVGGAVRDRLLGRPMGDLDLATPLLPGKLMELASKSGIRAIPTGLQHGTVTLMVEGQPVEVTTFRGDGAYLDGRRPAEVHFGVALEEDLARRDFTVNAMAVPLDAWLTPQWLTEMRDPFGGREDLIQRRLKAVGIPLLRFQEDGLRPLRACRFMAQLGFDLDPITEAAIGECLGVVEKVAVERVLVELTKLLCGAEACRGLMALERTGLLDLLLPELRPMVGCAQNTHHAWPVWEHTLAVVEAIPPEADLRWAALLHDTGKPESASLGPDGRIHFHGHEARSLAIAETILLRLRASKALQSSVLALIRHHGQVPDSSWSPAALRRHLGRLAESGLDLARWDVFRRADIQGKGVDIETSLRAHQSSFQRLLELESAKPPLHIKALALDGRQLMALAGRAGGPWLGALQQALLAEVMEDPALNTPASLERLTQKWMGAHPQP